MDHNEKIVRIIRCVVGEFWGCEIVLSRILQFTELFNYSIETEKILTDALMAAEGERQKKELPF